MTKLEELKAAYEAATPGEWEPLMTCGELHVCTPVNEGCDVGTVCVPYERSDAKFITLAHNLMPTLLEAVEVLERIERLYPKATILAEIQDARRVLEKLK